MGNILRAAERKPSEKYGLDAVICWSRLWLLLPDTVKQDLQAARADLNTAARVWLWSILFCGWAFLAWNPATPFLTNLLALWPLLGLLSVGLAYQWAIAAAQTYGELIESKPALIYTVTCSISLCAGSSPTTQPSSAALGKSLPAICGEDFEGYF